MTAIESLTKWFLHLPGVSDPNDPFNNNARPNSWTPPLNQSWTWGKDRVFGYVILPIFFLSLLVLIQSD